MVMRSSELSAVNMAEESVSAAMSDTLTITSGALMVRIVFAGTWLLNKTGVLNSIGAAEAVTSGSMSGRPSAAVIAMRVAHVLNRITIAVGVAPLSVVAASTSSTASNVLAFDAAVTSVTPAVLSVAAAIFATPVGRIPSHECLRGTVGHEVHGVLVPQRFV